MQSVVEREYADLLARRAMSDERSSCGKCCLNRPAGHAVAGVDGEHIPEVDSCTAERCDVDVPHGASVFGHAESVRSCDDSLWQVDDVPALRKRKPTDRRHLYPCRTRRLGSGGNCRYTNYERREEDASHVIFPRRTDLAAESRRRRRT